jgi:hypothetical protein
MIENPKDKEYEFELINPPKDKQAYALSKYIPKNYFCSFKVETRFDKVPKDTAWLRNKEMNFKITVDRWSNIIE